MQTLNGQVAGLIAMDGEFRNRLTALRGRVGECRARAREIGQSSVQIQPRVVGMLSDFLGGINYKPFVRTVNRRMMARLNRLDNSSWESGRVGVELKAECLSEILAEFVAYADSKGVSMEGAEVVDEYATYQTSVQHNAGSTHAGSTYQTTHSTVFETATGFSSRTIGVTVVAVIVVAVGVGASALTKAQIEDMRSHLIRQFVSLAEGVTEEPTPIPLCPHDIRNLFVRMFESSARSGQLDMLH